MQILKSFFKALGCGIKFINTYFKTFVLLLIVIWILIPSANSSSNLANLERIDLKGEIFDSSAVLEKIINAKNDSNIKGVLFVIDSPGGAFAPSMELALAIKDLKIKKPVLVYASGTMASGSYLAGVGANKILANPASFIGSIGVIMQGADLSGLANKLGIKEQTIQAGEFKSAGTFARAWNENERNFLQGLIDQSYDLFTGFVAKERALDLNKKDQWANARVFLAAKAKELGLIDELSNYENAKKELEKLANVSNPVWKEEDKIDKFLNRLEGQTSSLISKSLIEIAYKTNSSFINAR
ncbi:signal peptide peptidase SppA [Campylobacter jejuni]|uniref:Protease n=6 Tax=Campylobacter TaxID=194 RepID=Q0PC65_CAMJE|nr:MULTISPECIES: signal peptide peptidase SppA [Campylobacter]YP_002343532.1 protease [Campylobacter jejuni subsp. jejuni NCTC 11168 = ATCC 700819]APA80374.1 protease IV (PspA) [Campylobacter jejuni subsp. jejuni D42a]EAI3655649.1 signal peptide peptidase SppA [Campylobacter fetus]EEO8735117.1 signal peptide peptidase SppA [Campylobacter coli]ADC27716.1 signal peptide peptidase SppA, 36K type [Campylobacter jejuni subsp. jejuni IA3902]AFU42204.1 signal peptide peptidase SppA, 36K type [Campyl